MARLATGPVGGRRERAPRRRPRAPRAGACALVGVVAALALVPAAVLGDPPAARLPPLDLVAPPAVVTPQEVAAHLDEVVVLEIVIAAARFVDGRVVLEPVDAARTRLRIVLVPPMIGEGGGRLAERFAGRHVRVLGRVREFAGTYEIFSSDPDAIAAVDVALPQATIVPPQATIALPTGAARAPVASAPLAAPATPSAADTSAAERCSAARRDWATAGAAAGAPLGQLESCLAAGVPGCETELSAVRAALADVAACAERIRWHCARGS